jgi:hypothetical protein
MVLIEIFFVKRKKKYWCYFSRDTVWFNGTQQEGVGVSFTQKVIIRKGEQSLTSSPSKLTQNPLNCDEEISRLFVILLWLYL